MLISGANFGRLLNISRQQIYVFASRGKIIKLKNGKYDLDDPINLNFLTGRGISKIDAENIILS